MKNGITGGILRSVRFSDEEETRNLAAAVLSERNGISNLTVLKIVRIAKTEQAGVLQNATPPSKLPKVPYDFGQFVVCGRVMERKGRTPWPPITSTPTETDSR